MANQTSAELRQDHQPAILAPTGFGGSPGPVQAALRGNKLIKLSGTTDAKQIGLLYLISSFFFIVAGIEALLMRAEPARPGMQFLSLPENDQG